MEEETLRWNIKHLSISEYKEFNVFRSKNLKYVWLGGTQIHHSNEHFMAFTISYKKNMINLIILEEKIKTKLIFEFLNLKGINISSNSIILHLFYYPKIKKTRIKIYEDEMMSINVIIK